LDNWVYNPAISSIPTTSAAAITTTIWSEIDEVMLVAGTESEYVKAGSAWLACRSNTEVEKVDPLTGSSKLKVRVPVDRSTAKLTKLGGVESAIKLVTCTTLPGTIALLAMSVAKLDV